MSEQLRAGDWVEVRQPHEIAATLDAEGTLDGLPFMPEMVELCGRRFRVLRRAEKTCIEAPVGVYVVREFHRNNVYLLEELRCSGAHHDGCQRMCLFFWNIAWLRKVEDVRREVVSDLTGLEALLSKMKTKSAPDRYFCQSTQLIKATRPEPLKKNQILVKCFRDVQSGAVGVLEMIGLIIAPLYRKLRDRLFGRPRLLGSLTRTPVGTLGLQPGELVAIKSLEEVTATLDKQGRNRGLVCDIELTKMCGKEYRVRCRLERMISEATGMMREVHGTVILENNMCLCARVLGGCPRLDFTYWREVWLRRIEPPASKIQEEPVDNGAVTVH
jgi:hypothetical protein